MPKQFTGKWPNRYSIHYQDRQSWRDFIERTRQETVNPSEVIERLIALWTAGTIELHGLTKKVRGE
jgi:hypothetical protein